MRIRLETGRTGAYSAMTSQWSLARMAYSPRDVRFAVAL
jgi:hypothetical protein